MEDRRVLAAIVVLGAAALVAAAANLFGWRVDMEPIVIDTQTNGGVKAGTAWRGAR